VRADAHPELVGMPSKALTAGAPGTRCAVAFMVSSGCVIASATTVREVVKMKNTPQPLYQALVAACLLSARIKASVATAAAHELFTAGNS
jgi:hypothetical protein